MNVVCVCVYSFIVYTFNFYNTDHGAKEQMKIFNLLVTIW